LDEETRSRQNGLPGQSGVVAVTLANARHIEWFCVAVIENSNVIDTTKSRAALGTTTDCLEFSSGPQRESPRREVLRILQRENKGLETVIRLPWTL
jgi:hypothetical protein